MDATDVFGFCRPYLLEDEYILWKGRPQKGNVFKPGDLFTAAFAVMWLGFSLFWEMMALQSGQLFLIFWGLPFVAVGIYLLVGRFLSALFLRNKTFYVITNKKVLIKRGRRIQIYDGADLPPMDVTIHRNGNGTILFSENVYTRRGTSHRIYFMLENLSDVAAAQNAIERMDQKQQ